MRLASFGTVNWRETLQSWRVLNDPDCAPIRLPWFVCVGGMIQMPNALTPEELSDRFAVFRLSEYAESFAELVGETIREAIAVEPIPQPFGGRRWYFRCPRCGRRCASLYVLTTSFRFRCRHCRGLTYHVQRLDHVSRRQRAFRRMVRRLGADPETDGWDYLPPRPPGMRRTTCARWESRWDRLEETYEREFAIDFVRRFGRWLTL